MTNTVTLTIDDRQLSVPSGTLIVDAAKQIGIDIPVFCYHPKLSSAGMCRMCLVEVGTPLVDRATGEVQRDENGHPVIRWFPNLQTACTMPVSQGMVVRTQTERVASARKDIIEFLLTSHPLDCPICDKGGECPLQNQTMAYGVGVSRFDYDDKQHLAKRVPLGDLIILDRERCIQCGRCVRFQSEIADDPVLGFGHRGRKLEIITFSDPPFNSYFGGNTTDICPVGALTTRDFRFGARPWELTRHASLCNHCPVGCNITLDTRVEAQTGDWEIKRVMPRQNEKVNEIWICDKGRYGHHHARATDRLTTPLIRKNGELTKASWEEALDLIARKIKIVRPAEVAGVAGDRLSNEDLFLFQTMLRDVIGTPHIDTYPSAPGAHLIARYGVGAESDFNRLDQSSVILIVAGDVEEQAPIWFLRLKAAAQRGAHVITVNGRRTKLDRYASHNLRIRYGSAPHLLLGLTRSLIDEGLIDKGLINEDNDTKVEGLAKLKENLAGFDTASTERLTGVVAEDLKTAAKTFSQAKDVIVVFGREGLNDYGALALVQAATNLLLATGHAGRANNGLLPLWPHNNTQGAADMGVRPNAGPGHQEIIEHGWDFASMLSTISNRGIRLLWIAGADPAGDNPTITQALGALDFLVVQELFLTDTARQADVVLPALSFAERDGTYTSGDRRVQHFNSALPPLGQGRADWAIFADVADRLGADWNFDSSARVLATINKTVPQYEGITWEALRVTEPQWPPVGYDSIYFGGTAYQNDGGLGLRWQAGAEQENTKLAFEWIELPAMHDADLIAVPVRWLYDRGTLIDRSPLLIERLRGAVAEFNPQDADRLELTAAAQIKASLSGRTFGLTVHINQYVPQGVVLVHGNLPAGPLTLERVEHVEA